MEWIGTDPGRLVPGTRGSRPPLPDPAEAELRRGGDGELGEGGGSAVVGRRLR